VSDARAALWLIRTVRLVFAWILLYVIGAAVASVVLLLLDTAAIQVPNLVSPIAGVVIAIAAAAGGVWYDRALEGKRAKVRKMRDT
jgi:hypothetical protein